MEPDPSLFAPLGILAGFDPTVIALLVIMLLWIPGTWVILKGLDLADAQEERENNST